MVTFNTTATVADFATEILGIGSGNGISFVSGSFVGATDEGQRAVFSDGNATAPDVTPGDTGVHFTTGSVAEFEDGDDTTSGGVGGGGSNTQDADAERLGDLFVGDPADQDTFDAAGIVITFSTSDPVDIQLLLTFATEEYPEWIGQGFSDIGAVFLHEGTSTTFDNTELVAISNTETVVDGDGNNLNFFNVDTINNTAVLDNDTTGTSPPGAAALGQTDYDGLQVDRMVDLNLAGNTTYTLKIVVADVGDGAFNSGILVSYICFGEGTKIQTKNKLKTVEDLKIGDLVLTRDNGLQPIRWIGCSEVSGRTDAAPIKFLKGAIGNDRELILSPNHKVLVSGWRTELFLGVDEAMVPAKSLINDQTILRVPQDKIKYYHILLDNHELVLSNGVWTESFYPGPQALRMLDRKSLAELKQVAPEFFADDAPEPSTVAIAKRYEAASLASSYLN